MIESYAKQICDMLLLPPMSVIFENCDDLFCDGETIYVSKNIDAETDEVYCAIAKHIRYIWQVRNHPQLLAQCDESMNYAFSVNDADIDAYAFALMAADKLLGRDISKCIPKHLQNQAMQVASDMIIAFS